jgi:isopenicillin-N epimerase
MNAFGSHLRALWPLDPAVAYLNHGGYGVTPDEIAAVQADWRARIELNPTRFMTAEYPLAIRNAASVLARYVGAAPDDVVFIDNATSGCNAVLRSLDFQPDDEILLTNLSYGAIVKAARYAAGRAGAKVVIADVPLPARCEDDVVNAIAPHLNGRTRLAIFDHIVSPTGLVMPVHRLADLAHKAGARVLVDGAHVPGQLPLHVAATGADWYVANCHKWLFAPRACGFMWATGAARDAVHPLSISHGLNQGFTAEFDWTGTRDPSAFLSVPAAIEFHERMGGRQLMARNAELVHTQAGHIAAAWDTQLSAPVTMLASMVAIRVPPRFAASAEQALTLRAWLSNRNVEVALGFYAGAAWLRIAAQAYNDAADYACLSDILMDYKL